MTTDHQSIFRAQMEAALEADEQRLAGFRYLLVVSQQQQAAAPDDPVAWSQVKTLKGIIATAEAKVIALRDVLKRLDSGPEGCTELTTWQHLSQQEQAELVRCALAREYQRRVNHLAWDYGTKRYPHVHLRELGLLAEVRRSKTFVTYTITSAAADLLLAAPDDPGAHAFFPLANDMADIKDKLRRQGFRPEE